MAKILMVDDEEKIRFVVKEYAQFSGHEVAEAADGSQAVELCKRQDFDLIVMDIMMPKLNGWDATRRIRSMKRSDAGNVPIIAMSANAFAEDIINSRWMKRSCWKQ